MSLEALAHDLLAPPYSYPVFGAGGGLLYVLRQHLKRYAVRPIEYVARPVFGAVSAFAITIALQLPNHFTSLFVGYFGIDAWDALAARFRIPALGKHEAEDGKEPPPK